MTQPAGIEARAEPRYAFPEGVPPFIGSREAGGQSFTYVLVDVSQAGAGLLLPEARDERKRIAVGETLNLHLPFQINQRFFNQGTARWQRETERGQTCGVLLDRRVPLRYPIYVVFETGKIHFNLNAQGVDAPGKLVQRILEDAFYFKKGVKIYFDHLRPYLARLSLRPGESPAVEEIDRRLDRNIEKLEEFTKRAAAAGADLTWLDREALDRLRKAVGLELDAELMNQSFDARVVQPYLRSIRLIEHQLYSNYNTLALLHQSERSNVGEGS